MKQLLLNTLLILISNIQGMDVVLNIDTPHSPTRIPHHDSNRVDLTESQSLNSTLLNAVKDNDCNAVFRILNKENQLITFDPTEIKKACLKNTKMHAISPAAALTLTCLGCSSFTAGIILEYFNWQDSHRSDSQGPTKLCIDLSLLGVGISSMSFGIVNYLRNKELKKADAIQQLLIDHNVIENNIENEEVQRRI